MDVISLGDAIEYQLPSLYIKFLAKQRLKENNIYTSITKLIFK